MLKKKTSLVSPMASLNRGDSLEEGILKRRDLKLQGPLCTNIRYNVLEEMPG